MGRKNAGLYNRNYHTIQFLTISPGPSGQGTGLVVVGLRVRSRSAAEPPPCRVRSH